MDVDDENGAQKPRQADDYGVEVDFDGLDDADKEVRNDVSIIKCLTQQVQRHSGWHRNTR